MANISSLKMNPPANRLIGEMPKIGIRPAIDGRLGGVRESLEEQTMNMARNVARFLEENLHHYNGLPVECVIADTTIGGVAEAQTADQFQRGRRRLADGVACWCYGSRLWIGPLIPWRCGASTGRNGPAVYLAAVSAAHNQKGLPVFNIYGIGAGLRDMTIRRMQGQAALRAGLAVANMPASRTWRWAASRWASAVCEPPFLVTSACAETIDMSEFARRLDRGIYDHDEYERALA